MTRRSDWERWKDVINRALWWSNNSALCADCSIPLPHLPQPFSIALAETTPHPDLKTHTMHLPYFPSMGEKKPNQNNNQTKPQNQQETAAWYFAWLTREELISPISRDGNAGNEKYNTKVKQTVTEILHLDMLSDDLLRFWQSIMKNHLLCDLAAHFLCPA